VTVLRLKWTVVTCGFVREMPPVSGLRFDAFDVIYPSAPLCVRLLVFFTHSGLEMANFGDKVCIVSVLLYYSNFIFI
jgi:hypothetical protein